MKEMDTHEMKSQLFMKLHLIPCRIDNYLVKHALIPFDPIVHVTIYGKHGIW